MREIKHGTAYAYTRQRCRCDICRSARREYMQRYLVPGYRGNPKDVRNTPLSYFGHIENGSHAMSDYLGCNVSTVNKHLKRHRCLDHIKRKKGRR